MCFYAFQREHWPKIRSTNPLERVNKQIGRRSDVVGICPNDRALIRLAGMHLETAHPKARPCVEIPLGELLASRGRTPATLVLGEDRRTSRHRARLTALSTIPHIGWRPGPDYRKDPGRHRRRTKRGEPPAVGPKTEPSLLA